MNLHSDELAYEIEDPADMTLLRHPPGAYTLALQVVPLGNVVPHEHFHGQRVAELSARLVQEGRLINPPVVARQVGANQGEQYVVLDGATRLTAFRHLGYPYIIVQVVDFVQQQVQLTSWSHAVYGGSVAGLLDLLHAVDGLHLTPSAEANPANGELPPGALGHLTTVDNKSFVLEVRPLSSSGSGDGRDTWLGVLNQMVEAYGRWGNVERTLNTDMESLAAQFPELAALFVFPHFTPQLIMELAGQGRTVPAGITRFVIPGRVLRLNAPLDKLVADEPLAAKQEWLNELIRQKLRDRQVRFYEEPVVLLDE
jgi:L-serine kinase (ATP) / ParB family transcriptional regulator, heme-responsive regulator